MVGESKEHLLDLENASIELDIAIDEQDEERCNRVVDIDKTVIDNIIAAENPKELSNILMDFPAFKICGKIDANGFWRVYFLAKRIRGIFQNDNTDTQSEKLHWVVDILIREATSEIRDDEQFQYLLLMLELAACNMGEQSLGYAEKALKILSNIKSEPFEGWNENAYKALIHYNEGVAKQHMTLYDSAIALYDKAISKLEPNGINKLWRDYVYHPTILQRAETLIKMPFAYNALETLKTIDNEHANNFHIARRKLLEATCYIELADWEKFVEQWKLIERRISDNFFPLKIPSNGADGNLNYLSQREPITHESRPSILASSCNSLILEGAKWQLGKEISERIKKNDPKKKREKCEKEVLCQVKNIIYFINIYMDKFKNNRFEKLTIEETILNFLEVLGEILGKNFFEDSELRKPIISLLELLNKYFIEDVDTLKKPAFHPDTIVKAKNVLGNMNDKILKSWFEENVLLARDLQICFELEKRFIDTLLKPVNRPKSELTKKDYDDRSLRIRSNLLKKISQKSYDLENLKGPKGLKNNLVCLWSDEGHDNEDENFYTNRTRCVQHFIDSMVGDDKKDFILQFANYDDILRRESRRFEKHVTGRSLQPLPENDDDECCSVNYVGLRRWNSYTPQLSFSVGGGHFVFLSKNKEKGKVSIGMAIDPGFDFIRNFFRQGFTLTDIDIVLLTHGHPDHIRDFPAIVELLNENKKRSGEQKKIYAIMSSGCYERLDDFIAKPPYKHFFYDTIITDINNNVNYEDDPIMFRYDDKKQVILMPPKDKDSKGNIQLNIKCFKSFHDDCSPSDSYGYIVKFFHNDKNGESDNKSITLGFTGDSKWMPQYAEKFAEDGCDVICSHIGSIADPEKEAFLNKFYIGKAEKLMRKKNHPYLFGEILFLQDWKEAFKKKNKNALILISEFGEEMKGQIRSDLVKRFNYLRTSDTGCWSDLGPNVTRCKWMPHFNSLFPDNKCSKGLMCKENAKNIFALPIDVGFRLSIPLTVKKSFKKDKDNELPGKVQCVVCNEFVEPDKIEYEVYSHEEAIFYLCNTCMRSAPIDVRHSIYQKYHEKGREIEKNDL